MQTKEVLVTGGTGQLGRRVADRLRARGYGVRVMSRSGSSGTVQGDLATGEGIEESVRGIETIVHCASSPIRHSRRTDVGGTDLLLGAAQRSGVSHTVFISIVGVERNPHYFYYRVKRDTESVIERSAVPWTILKATQFHEFVLKQIKFLDRGPVALVPKGFLLQSINIGEVADRLVELALSEPAGRVPDIGGPEVRIFANLARAYIDTTGRAKRVMEVSVPGKMARAFREGAQTCPGYEYGKIRWEEFLNHTTR